MSGFTNETSGFGKEHDDPHDSKASLRDYFLSRRENICEDDRNGYDDAIRRRLRYWLSHWSATGSLVPGQEKTVALYAAIRHEVQIDPAAMDLLSDGWTPLLPRTDVGQRQLEFHRFDPCVPLVRGPYGIMEPPSRFDTVVPAEAILVVAVPGVAFSQTGARLGYGGGYYDRFLTTPGVRAVRVGIAYDCQVTDQLPEQAHDAPVDWIITQSQAIRCRTL